jgi:hypothetical protein
LRRLALRSFECFQLTSAGSIAPYELVPPIERTDPASTNEVPLRPRPEERAPRTVNSPSLRAYKCTVRQVNMTISLAFLAPDLVKAAVEGRLPRGIGIARLRDAPVEWSRQHAMLGLTS